MISLHSIKQEIASVRSLSTTDTDTARRILDVLDEIVRHLEDLESKADKPASYTTYWDA